MSRSFILGSVSLLALVAGCHHERASLPSTNYTAHDETTTTSAMLPGPPIMMAATPGIAVSSDIAKACNLAVATTPENAPQFGFDETTLTFSDFELLNQVGACLSTGPLAGRHVELIGRTDAMGTTEYNMSLGARRASAVAQQLQTAGAKAGQLDQTSRGELDAQGQDPAGRQVDRRVDIVLR